MKANGLTANVMDKVNRHGLMVHVTLASGKMEKQTDMGHCTTLTMISMKATGWTIKQTATEPILMQMVQSMSVSGKTTNNMVSASRPGLMEQFMKAHTSRVKRMAKANLHLLMAQSTKANSK